MEIIEFIGSRGREIAIFFCFLFSLCFHEFAHGYVAKLKGDRTAAMMGRLTLNPLAHIDWLGTVILPLFALFYKVPFFGWAKPVPVNERNLSRPRQDLFWIALAGPLSNLGLALVATVVLAIMYPLARTLGEFASMVELVKYFIVINLFLAVFNLIPLHPLDGGKVISRFLSPKANRALEEVQSYTMIILVVVFLVGGFGLLAAPVFWFAGILDHLALQLAYAIS